MNILEIIFRPLEGPWPRPFTEDSQRKRAPFKTHTIDQNLRVLKSELASLESSVVVVQTAHAERDFSDSIGRPRGDRRPEHPGVIVAADTKHGSLKWVCDDCREWNDNIRAIALTLERLRLADRYGVTRKGEQYAGWKMLPGPITSPFAPEQMSMDEAARFVGKFAGEDASRLIGSRECWQRAFRQMVKQMHPDAGGTPAEWEKFQQAAGLLNSLHNRK